MVFRIAHRINGLLLLVLLFESTQAGDQPGISAQTYEQRRAALLEMMPDSSLAIFHSALEKKRSNDVNFEYRQDSNLFYLTGMPMPGAALIVAKKGVRFEGKPVNEILFVPESNRFRARVEGTVMSAEAASRLSGIQMVMTYGDFQGIIERLLPEQAVVFFRYPLDFFHERLSNQRIFIAHLSKEAMQQKYPGIEIRPPDEFIPRLRQIKSVEELIVLRKSIDITCEALAEAMRATRPGLYEYQIEAINEYVFKYSGAAYPAFPSIVGSGPNSTILHYWKNHRQTQDGDLVVMDVGAEYLGYSADVTRTIPVNGKFSPRQREIYEIVLSAQQAAIRRVRPGVTLAEVHEAAKQLIDSAGYGNYFIHATSHYLGLDTHDVGDGSILQPGMVVTVEPGIYIPAGARIDRAYWNIGVRIEDDVLVTSGGCKVLSNHLPSSVEDIEHQMRQTSKWTISR